MNSRVYKIQNIKEKVFYLVEYNIDKKFDAQITFLSNINLFIYSGYTTVNLNSYDYKKHNKLIYDKQKISNIKIQFHEQENRWMEPYVKNIKFDIYDPTTKKYNNYEINPKFNLETSIYMNYIFKLLDFCNINNENFNIFSHSILNSNLINIVNTSSIKMLEFINFKGYLNALKFQDIVITNFFDGYLKKVICDSFTKDLDYLFQDIKYDHINLNNRTIIIKNCNMFDKIVKAKVYLHFTKVYDLNNHIMYYLEKYNCR